MNVPFIAAHDWALVGALILGLGFGVVLERAGFGRALKLTAQFYLTDMSVFKVMFGAVVTAALGVVLLDGLDLVSLRAITEVAASETFVWPMALGGFVLGVGFVVSGYCPGTSIVGWASGHIDGMLTVVGVFLGSWLFAETYDWVKPFHLSGSRGMWMVYDWLGVPPALLVGVVAIVAIGLFVGAEAVERRFAGTTAPRESASPLLRKRRRVAFATFATSAALGIATLALPEPAASITTRRAETVGVETVARQIIEAPWSVRTLDLRKAEDCAKARLPGSECVSRESLADLGLADAPSARALLLIDDQTVDTLPPEVEAFRGQVLTLQGGFDAWREFALTPATPPAGTLDAEAVTRYQLRSALHRVLTGTPQAPPPSTTAAPGVAAPKKKKKGGGCG